MDKRVSVVTLNASASGIFGIDYTFESGDNKADIYVDGELYESPTVTFNYDSSQRHIMVVRSMSGSDPNVVTLAST